MTEPTTQSIATPPNEGVYVVAAFIVGANEPTGRQRRRPRRMLCETCHRTALLLTGDGNVKIYDPSSWDLIGQY